MSPAGHILVVEDNAPLLGVIALSLRNAGFEVTTAANGADAWAFLEANDVGLVLTDVNMPGMSGGSLCEAIRSEPRHRETPIMLLTALSADIQADPRFESLGVAAVIRKPFSPREVTAMVRELVRHDRRLSTTPAVVSSDAHPASTSD